MSAVCSKPSINTWLAEPPPRPRALIARRAAGLLFLLALIPRLALTLAFLRMPIGLDDMFQYDMLARSLAAGNGYRWYQREAVARLKPYLDQLLPQELDLEAVPLEGFQTIFRAPGYPAFLALIYRLGGFENRLAWARIVQALLGALLAPLAAYFASTLTSPKAAVLAGAVVALYPILWLYPSGLASENLFLPLVLLGLLALLADPHARRARWGTLSGLVLGAATLTRGSLVLFLPLAWLWLWRHRSPRHAALSMLAAMLLLLPWAARNSLIAGRPAFVENTAGYNLYIGYHPKGDGTFLSAAPGPPNRHWASSARIQAACRACYCAVWRLWRAGRTASCATSTAITSSAPFPNPGWPFSMPCW